MTVFLCHPVVLYDNKVNQVPVLWARVHPGGLVFVLELKHGVSDTERKLWAVFSLYHQLLSNNTSFPNAIPQNLLVEKTLLSARRLASFLFSTKLKSLRVFISPKHFICPIIHINSAVDLTQTCCPSLQRYLNRVCTWRTTYTTALTPLKCASVNSVQRTMFWLVSRFNSPVW